MDQLQAPTDLRQLVDDTLIANLPAGLKDAIRGAIALGAGKAKIMRKVERAGAARHTMTYLACEAFVDSLLEVGGCAGCGAKFSSMAEAVAHEHPGEDD